MLRLTEVGNQAFGHRHGGVRFIDRGELMRKGIAREGQDGPRMKVGWFVNSD
jgi:hypothetical protein